MILISFFRIIWLFLYLLLYFKGKPLGEVVDKDLAKEEGEDRVLVDLSRGLTLSPLNPLTPPTPLPCRFLMVSIRFLSNLCNGLMFDVRHCKFW